MRDQPLKLLGLLLARLFAAIVQVLEFELLLFFDLIIGDNTRVALRLVLVTWITLIQVDVVLSEELGAVVFAFFVQTIAPLFRAC